MTTTESIDVRDRGEAAPRPRIAVVGISAIMPGAEDVDAYWRNIVAGVSAVQEVPASHWLLSDHFDPDPKAPDKTYSNRGAFLDPVDFDPMAFGVPPTNLSSTDPAQLLALIAARELLEDVADGDFRTLDLERTAIVLGTSSTTQLAMTFAARSAAPIWRKALREAGLAEPKVDEVCQRITDHFVGWQESSFPGMLGNIVAGRIANRFNLGGMNCITDAACASSLAALSAALGELYLGNADMVITGGVDILNDPMMYLCFSKTRAMSPTGDCRPFSGDADGTIMGEGIAMFALKRLEDAERDGNRIYATIAGLGASSDGTAKSVYAPVAVGQARAIRRAYTAAGYDPDSVGLLEAHGTATKVGDQVEVAALRSVFPEESRKRYCALGSVKSQIGHTKAAASAAGLAKAILSLHGKVLPPTINADRANESLELDRSAFYLNTELRPWIQGRAPRRAAVSSFGFGGANYHVTLEEYQGSGRRGRTVSALPDRLMLFSAATATGLVNTIKQVDAIRAEHGFAVAVLESLDTFDASAAFCLALVTTASEASAALADVITRVQADPGAPFVLPGGIRYLPEQGSTSEPGGLAFLFSGQGSQYLGMGGPIASAFSEARAVWDTHAARGIHDVVFPPALADPATRAEASRRLTATDVAQPGLALSSLATLVALQTAGVRCNMVAGHSFGELPALYAAGAFDQATLLDLATARGAAMAATDAANGAMLAIEAPDEECESLLDAWSNRVFLANRNAPGQVSVSGLGSDIDALAAHLAARKMKAVRLPVGAAFHSPLVASAAEAFAEALARAKVVAPNIPVFSNLDGTPFPSDADAIRARLAEQVAAPVQFADTIEAMHEQGARHFVEVGPGTVLTGLVGRILGNRPHVALATAPRGATTAAGFLATLGTLALHGIAVDLGRLRAWDEATRPRRARPPLIISVNSVPIGRKYPPENGEVGLAAPITAPPEAAPLIEPGPLSVADDTRAPANGFAGIDVAATDLMREIHEHSAALHQQYLQAMTDTHAAFLDVAGRALDQVGTTSPFAWGGSVQHGSDRAIGTATGTTFGTTSAAASPDVLPAPPAVPPMSTAAPVHQTAAPSSAEHASVEPAASPVDSSAVALPGGPVDFVHEMMAVVAEKTGYPPELLRLDMELEAGLGIDSIKRMEIFAALRERHPILENVDMSRVGEVRTFADVVALLENPGDAVDLGAPAPTDSTMSPTDSTTSEVPSPSVTSRRVVALVAAEAPHVPTPGIGEASAISVCPVGTSSLAAANALVDAFTAAGQAATRVTPDAADPSTAVVLVMPSGEGGAETGVAAAAEAIAAARALATRGDGAGCACVIAGEGLAHTANAGSSPWLAGFDALARSLALEWPHTCVRYVDAARGGDEADLSSWAARVVTEVLDGGDTAVVAVPADGARLVPTLVDEPAHAGPDPLEVSDVVVVSGGARGITAAAVRALAARRPLRFLLLGRTELAEEPTILVGADSDAELKRRLIAMATVDDQPVDLPTIGAAAAAIQHAREVRATIADLEKAGSEVRYVCVDVRDAQAVHDAIAEARTAWGPLAALIHGAGVTADKLVVDKGDAQARLVLATKLLGLENLLSATADDPLRLIVLFSSVVARSGNAGQTDYAIANEMLNAVARAEAARRPDTCVVKSIGWGPWDGGLVTEAIGAQFRARNIGLFTTDDGARAFLDELADRRSGAVDPLITAVQPA